MNPEEASLFYVAFEDRCIVDEAREALAFWQAKVERPEFVYFIRQVNNEDEPFGAVKIGTAKDPMKRAAELQCGCPEQLRIVELILGSRELEDRLHRAWKAQQVRREWYGRGYEEIIVAAATATRVAQIGHYTCCGRWTLRTIYHDIPLSHIPAVHMQLREAGFAA